MNEEWHYFWEGFERALISVELSIPATKQNEEALKMIKELRKKADMLIGSDVLSTLNKFKEA